MMKSNDLKAKTRLFTPAGDKTIFSLAKEYDEEIKLDKIVVKNEIDIQEELQRSSNSYDLAMMKKKYQLTGEIPAQIGGFGDTELDLTVIPDDIHSLYKARNQLQDKFNTLDPALIKAYGSFEAFVTSVYTGVIPENVKTYYTSKKNEDELKQLKEAQVNAQ